MSIKKAVVNFIQMSVNQSKNIQRMNIGDKRMFNIELNNKNINLLKQVSFSITHAKHVTDTHKMNQISGQYKHFQKTATYVHCFNKKTHHQQDVPFRIYRTIHTVTFLPSVQYLQLKHPKLYHQQKDTLMTIHEFNCKHCGNKQSRQFPQNGYEFGTVLTGCDQCHELVVIADRLNWVEDKKNKENQKNQLIFSKKNVMDIVRKNLKKVGFNMDKY